MLMNPNSSYAGPSSMPPVKLPKQSHMSFFVAILMTILFVCSLGFGVWAYMGMQENQSNLDAKIEKASAAAVKEAEAAKDAAFAEEEKDPYRTYTGTSTYGSLTYDFPKTWSVYQVEKTSGTVLDYYGHPFIVKGTGKENSFAFRVQVVETSYDKELAKFDAQIKKGTVTASAFRLARVPDQLGSRLTGEIITEKQGVLVLLPLRDKTIKIWTESTDYVGDFDQVLETVSFNP
jgi:hypothetical protein